MKSSKISEITIQIIIGGILFLIALCMLLPFMYVFSLSFTDVSVYKSGELVLIPQKWSIEAYKLIIASKGFINAFKSTAFITLIGAPASVVINAMMAYMLSKKFLPGRGIILKLVLFTMLFSPGLIPNYILYKQLNLLNSLWVLILPGLAGAYTLLVMKSFYQGIPVELEEAAQIDGCGDIMTFVRIIIPMSKAMLAVFFLFATINHWNVYASAIFFITNTKKWTLQVFLNQIIAANNLAEMEIDIVGRSAANVFSKVPTEVLQMATTMTITFPILIVYPFLQKHFTKGVYLGSVKG